MKSYVLEFDLRKDFNQFCLGKQVVCSFWREVKSASGNNNVQFSGGPKIISHCAHSDVEIRKIIIKYPTPVKTNKQTIIDQPTTKAVGT